MKNHLIGKYILFLGLLLLLPLHGTAAIDYFSAKNLTSLDPKEQPAYFSTQTVDHLSPEDYAETLHWLLLDNLCGGYYQETAIILNPVTTDLANTTTITATMPSLLSQAGTSILQGQVTVTQPGRQIIADKVYVNRDPKTGKLSSIDALGNVHIREPGKLVVAQKAHENIQTHFGTITNAVYRFTKPVENGILNAWGIARYGEREASGIMHFQHASYSTCSPLHRTWQVKAEKLHLDRKAGKGTAINSTVQLWQMPVFYVPYFTFPLDDRRKSGFLFPTYSYSASSGASISVPYYFNLAPNYDATYTPDFMSDRGLQHNLNFRYLTLYDVGNLNFSILPDDHAFAHFQETAAASYANVPDEDVYLRHLDNDSTTRSSINYMDSSVFNEHWNSSIVANYVSDDYYLQDFASTPAAITTDQLLNEADVNYQSEHWRWLWRVQGYQILHPINAGPVEDLYTRLPEMDANADYPDQDFGLDYQLTSQFVNFEHSNDFLTGTPVVDGQRYRVTPSIHLPIANMSGYFTPQLQWDNTQYELYNQMPLESNEITRSLPIFDIDTGLFFDRETEWFGHHFRQTLEPRLFYLYVPFESQNDIPLFDTNLAPFSFEQMFQTNRFTGEDRVGDANQITFALTSRFLNDENGEERLRASVGGIYLFQQHKVFCNDSISCSPDPTVNEKLSPLAGELSYYLTPLWNIIGNIAWDPNRTHLEDESVNVIYNHDKKVLNVGYYFVSGVDMTAEPTVPVFNPVNTVDLNRVNIGFAWPLPMSERWSAIADWNYNISQHYTQVYFYGIQYDSCCFAARLVNSHTFLSIDQAGNTHTDNEFYVQIQLKGLGNFGYNNASGLLSSALPGYRDQFLGTIRPMS